jgi:opacity protein-like surface antigen
LFGPRFTSRPGRVEGFVHALLGGARASGGGDSDTSFTYALGGGLDIKASDRVAIRIVQLDYLRTHFSDNWQNNFRYSTGLVFRLGKK